MHTARSAACAHEGCALSLPPIPLLAVLEGYGLTETSCLVCLTPPGDPVAGHVGPPSPACEVKLEDIPEMNYTNGDSPWPRGEAS